MKLKISPMTVLVMAGPILAGIACLVNGTHPSDQPVPEPAPIPDAVCAIQPSRHFSPAMLAPALEERRPSVASGADSDSETEEAIELLERGSEAMPRRSLAAAWVNVDFDQTLAHVQSETRGPGWAARDLEHWLISHPENGAQTVLNALGAGTTNDWSTSGLLIEALIQAGTPSARQALVSILSDTDAYTPTAVIQAAMAASEFGAEADPGLIELLVGMIDSPVADDQYRLSEAALGSLARLADGDAALQQVLRQQLKPWLDPAAAPEQTAKALSVLARAGMNDAGLDE